MRRKKKSKCNIQLYNMKKTVKEEIAEKTSKKILNELIDEIALQYLREKPDYIPNNPRKYFYDYFERDTKKKFSARYRE